MSDLNADGDWDSDSAVGLSSYGTSLASISSAMHEPVEENGRTYHAYKSGKYLLPNDKKEQSRLDLQHAIFMHLFDNKLAFAPVDQIPLRNVLDIATGTGVWAIEFADEHPSANVIGTDLSPIQPHYVPLNCSFIVDDAEDEWGFREPFDYIHARAVVTCFADPSKVIRSAFAALAPGGYLEYQDVVFPASWADAPPEDCQFKKWNELSLEASIKAGRPWTGTPNYAQWMRDIGFEDVQERKFILPAGSWPEDEKLKKIGTTHLHNWILGIEAMTTRNLARLGWSVEQSLELAGKVKAEFQRDTVKPYNDILVVTGRKPGK